MLNSTDKSSFWVPETIVNDGVVRGVFRTYFLVLIIFIAIMGNWCLRLWIKHKLLRGRPVFLNQTTGWIHGPGLAKMTFDMRKLPGGWLGWMMIIVTILDLIGDYGVSLTVKSQTLGTIRDYYSGGYVSANAKTTVPTFTGEAFRWATAAQQNSYRNANATNLAEKHYGIYSMMTNDTSFMARVEDIIGYWSCARNTTEPLIYDQKWKDPTHKEIYDMDIWNDLIEHDQMYPGWSNTISNVSFYDSQTGAAYGPSTHLTIFSASDLDYGTLFNISAAVDILDTDNLGSKQIHIFKCELRAKDAAKTVESIAKTIDISSVLDLWKNVMNGAMFPGLNTKFSHDPEDIEVILQLHLNAMMMVAGSDENVLNQKQTPTPLGIVVRATKIPYWIVVVCIIVWVVASFLTAVAIYLFFVTRAESLLHDNKNKDGTIVSGHEIRNNTPVGLLDWMAHAGYESRDADQLPEHKNLKSWILSTTWHAGRRLAIVRSSEQGQVNPLRTPGSASMGGQFTPAQQQMGYFPETKNGYVSVASREGQ